LLYGDVFEASRSRLRRGCRRRLCRRCRRRLCRRGLRGRLLLLRCLRAQLRRASSAKIYRHHADTDEPEDPHASIPFHFALSRPASIAVASLSLASLPIRLTHRNCSTRQNHDRRQLSQHFSGSSRRATTSVAGYRCDVWAQFSTVRGALRSYCKAFPSPTFWRMKPTIASSEAPG